MSPLDAPPGAAGSLESLSRRAAETLVAAGIPREEAFLDAELLAREVLGWSRATFLTRRLEPAPADFADPFGQLVGRRAAREPVAYILGRQEFWGLDFEVTPAVLVPRPETELLVEEALARFDEATGPAIVLDVGTGSGCLAVVLAKTFPHAAVIATDISGSALGVARRNARTHGVDRRIEFRHVAGCDHLANVSLLVSNPPYVRDGDRPGLPPEVRDYEPATALFAGADGLDVVRSLVREAQEVVAPGGWLLFEFGVGQDEAIGALLAGSLDWQGQPAWTDVAVRPDLQGIPRVAAACRA